tara:strand:- start:1159 stop:1797 length:639 start_codon:yes stop_codon:yes gene_type:complete
MADILIRLSNQLDGAIPQLVLVAVFRKIASSFVSFAAIVFRCSSLSEHRVAVAISRNYHYIQMQVDHAWAVAYFLLIFYVVYDCFLNLDEFLNCRDHPVPRPIGIFCAVSLTCFVFTTKLSVSTLSVVVMLCARDMSTMTGLACVLNFAVWANIKGSSVFMAVCCLLSGMKYVFCGKASNAALLTANICWLCTWAWIAVVSKALVGPGRKNQ